MWLEIDVETKGEDIRIGGRSSRGERLRAHWLAPERGMDALQSFANHVGRAVQGGKPLDPAVVTAAQALYEGVLTGELRDVIARMNEASKHDGLLVRLFIEDRRLQAVPWEALCKPGTTEGFWGTSPKTIVARGVSSSDPCSWEEPREVRGAVRVLAIAPGSDEREVLFLREELDRSICVGEIEWLDPIAGPDISARMLFDRLRRGKTPHIIHWLGYGGVDISGNPVLRMADAKDGKEVWTTAESLARELSASFCEELRLVVFEACEGTKAGAFGSAAEILMKTGVDAVIAYLWPVKADTARACSTEIYGSLTASDRTPGDIGASVAAARRTLLTQSAEAFSPILYLRGPESVIFNFEGRRVSRPSSKRKSRTIAPALQSLLERPFSMVLGDLDEHKTTLWKEIAQFMTEKGDNPDETMSLSALTQRCMLRFGQDVLSFLFQQTFAGTRPTTPPLIDAIARFVQPGLHLSLLWHPHLEHAIADKQPGRTVYAIQPSLASTSGKPRVVKRAAGATLWKMEPILPKRFDLDNDIVVLRLYGGYSAEARPILSQPLIMEDDHIHRLGGAEGFQPPPPWMEELLVRPRIQPGLFIGMSILDWHHRKMLCWLYDQRPAPKDSLVILTPAADPREPEIWDSGRGLPGTGRIVPITEDPDQLASMLEGFDPPADR